MAFKEYHAVRSDNTQGGNCMTEGSEQTVEKMRQDG